MMKTTPTRRILERKCKKRKYEEISDNEVHYGQHRKSHPTVRNSTARQLNIPPVTTKDKEFCCTECNMLFWTPKELFNHTRNYHLVQSLLNNGNIQEDDIEIVKVVHKSTDRQLLKKNRKGNNNSVLMETYYYFCLDCDEERGDKNKFTNLRI